MTPERNQDPGKDLSKLMEQSVSTLQEVDRRLQMVRNDLASLITRASSAQGASPDGGALPRTGGVGLGAPGPGAFGGAGAFGGPFGGAPAGPSAMAGFGGAQGLYPPPGVAPQAPLSALLGGPQAPRTTRDVQQAPPTPRVPTVDIVDKGEEYIVQIELPGVKKEDLDLMVTERTVSLDAHARPDVDEGAVLLSERGPVVYRRLIPFPSEVATTQSKAAFKDGILTLTVPKKSPGDGPRKLDVAYS